MVRIVGTQLSGKPVLDSVVGDYRWGERTLTFGFRVQDIDGNGVNDFDEGNWRGFYGAIFANVAQFTNLTFTETRFELATLNQLMVIGGGGQSSNPYPNLANDLGGRAQTYTQVGIEGDVAASSEVVRLGRFSEVWFHEIGHSLGLRHSFEVPNLIDDNVRSDGDLGDHFINSNLYAHMSYSPFVWGEDDPWTAAYDPGQTVLNAGGGTFMPIDIAGLQQMYGRRAHATGNDIYVFTDDLEANDGYRTIWDTAGIDTIRYDGDSDAKIDLRAATLQKEIGGGGFLSTSRTLTGGFLIANGVRIENATGGDGDDIVIGNAVANTLRGGAGDDALAGGAGNDQLFGDAGDDVLDGGAGVDQLTGGAGADRFVAARDGSVDRVLDFSRAEGDRVDLPVLGDGFDFIGAGRFTGVAGQVRYQVANGWTTVQVDLDGDRVVDVRMMLAGNQSLTVGDLIL